MIDFHTHALPGIDDGARDREMTKAMLEEAKRQGVKTVLLTSHYYGKRRSPASFLEKRVEAYEKLRSVAPEDMEFRLAAEVHFTGDSVVSYEDICRLRIEGTRYVLFEFSFTSAWLKNLPEKVADFIAETGYVPVIAHAERYTEFVKNPKLLFEFVSMGCLIQVNSDAFLEKGTKQMAFAMLRHGLVHCIGSDMHNVDDRPPNLAAAKAAFEEAGEKEAFERLQENMRLILADQPVPVHATPMKKILGKYF
ncbi:MAG: hypothetical protein IJX81_07245 [Clostridia bacterium]|nr:hypothetical protein [Clostridia bacterium]